MAVAGFDAAAQSNITGSIFGQVSSEAGDSVEIRNADTGFTRHVTVDKEGRYRFSSLPTGRYSVTLKREGASVSARDNVELSIAGGTEVSFGASAQAHASGDAKNLEGVSVVASALPAIDVSSVDTRTVLTAEQLNKLPIARDISAAALLAPSVVANSSYGVPSFGGAASSENAYFINGYAVTNPLTSIGFTQLPFDAIDQQQVLTGGYGAEFGRSTGGVINIVTKRGSNQTKAGLYTIWEPEALRANPRNNYFPRTGAASNATTDGALLHYRHRNQYWKSTVGAYLSGALVKDRLFYYLDAEMNRQEGASVLSYSNSSGAVSKTGYSSYSHKMPRWTGKLDWNITDSHILELTGVSDKTLYQSDRYAYSYKTLSHGEQQTGGVYTKDGGDLYIGKYTGYLTDDLTVSALYGTQKVNHVYSSDGYDPGCPYISVNSGAAVPGLVYNTCQQAVSPPGTSTIPLPGANDKTEGWRLDVEYRIGDHDLRLGYDAQNAKSFTGKQYAGNYAWIYAKQTNANAPVDAGLGVIGSPAQAGGLGTEGYYVYKLYNTQRAGVETDQAAQFIEDRWQVTERWLLSLGLRNEQFTNYNKNGDAYIRQRHQLAPRLGASWDVFGDATLKLFANAGRYHLAVPNNAAVRSVSGSLISNQYFTYTGVDTVSGVPLGLNPIAVDPVSPYICPNTGGVSSNQECGDAPDPRTVAAKGLRSHFQDEYILGMEQQINPSYSYGVKLTYRKLMSAIDDTCVAALGGRCLTFNPGRGNTFEVLQPDGSLASVYLSKQELGLPDLKRKYYAVDLFIEHPLADKWYGKAEYTFSRNYGNTEGQLASDLDTGSGGQTDVSRTQDWDLPQLMVGANGLLPNHRAHQVKAFGYYQLNPEWRIGATLIAASGRPKNCTSYYPTADKGLYNSSTYWFCGLPGQPGYEFSPRGSHGTTPWTYQLNLNVAYTPGWMANKLTLQLDGINMFNKQTPTMYNYRYAANRTTVNPLYGRELNYTDPRYFRLTVRYDL
ncbi:TonB-dependent receptor [Dyella sp. ASV21]|uniref:TonB-dependent receptor n=1 Tax=Dyella sp. ASV21 TaxID=2795114 RepID=UPI001E4BAFEC|nr:TonB-dependent receptor [Dyella sp. ASV21]